jgi:hypothetical protein
MEERVAGGAYREKRKGDDVLITRRKIAREIYTVSSGFGLLQEKYTLFPLGLV